MRLSLLEMIVEGHWNYPAFDVVPPGWQLVVDQNLRVIDTEEIPL